MPPPRPRSTSPATAFPRSSPATPGPTGSTAGLALVRRTSREFAYVAEPAQAKSPPAWEIILGENGLKLRSRFQPGRSNKPFTLRFDQKANHATLLGLLETGGRRTRLPAVLHLPDLGSVRIRCDAKDATLDYDARRYVKPSFVEVSFPPATADQRKVEYRLEVAAIHPRLPGLEQDARFDGFRRGYLNILQVNPRVQMLANNSSSDPCAFTLFEYAEIARRAPPLAKPSNFPGERPRCSIGSRFRLAPRCCSIP